MTTPPLRPSYGEPRTYWSVHDEIGNGADLTVGWDLSWGCQVGFSFNEGKLHFFASLSDKAGNGHERRAVTRDQLRDFACRLIALASHGEEPS